MRISEVSETTGLSADTLRYYEREGLLGRVTRNDSGVRDYSSADLQRIEFVKCMRSAGVSVEALSEYMRLFDQGDETWERRRDILIEQRAALAERVQELQDTLRRLDYKIENYETLGRITFE